MDESADKDKEKEEKTRGKPWYIFQFIAGAMAFYGIRALFDREYIANQYLGYPLTVTAGTCLYLMLDALIAWYFASGEKALPKWFRFGMVLLFLPVVVFAAMILLFLASYLCDTTGLFSLSKFILYGLFPTIPSLATKSLLSGINLTINLTMPPAFLGMVIMTFEFFRVSEDL